ncbi:SKU5 similar 9 [Raphanus sativus]|nr:SKU5 similar 9 [Raphanus sativus]
MYTSLDIHVGQSLSVLVTIDQPPENYSVVVDTRFVDARSIKTNLTASGQRKNAQGSSHYGRVKISRTLILESSAGVVNRKQRYGINGVSFVPADTPLKLADYFKIKGV